MSPGALASSVVIEGFSILAAERLTDEQHALDFIDGIEKFNITVAGEDVLITQKMHLRVGTLTESECLRYRFYNEHVARRACCIAVHGKLGGR